MHGFLLKVVAVTLIVCSTLMSLSVWGQDQPENLSDLMSRPAPSATIRVFYGDGPEQFADLWMPTDTHKHPVVLMIHGGCWQASLPGVDLMSYIAEDLRKTGFAVWNIEYRRLGDRGAGYPGTFLDVENAIDYLTKIEGLYDLDLTKVAIIGHSAGGQLALWAAARGKLKSESALYAPHPLPLKFVITLSGINDLAAYHEDGPAVCGGPSTIDHLIGAQTRTTENPYNDTSPAALLPFPGEHLIVSGSLDPIVPSKFGDDFVSLALAKGDGAKSLSIENAGHFELIDPRSDAWIKIKKSLLSKMSP